jgi:PAS domain S-box-containing protein
MERGKMAPESSVQVLKQRVKELEQELAQCRKIEEELRESEQKFKTLFANASDEIIYIDADGTAVEINDKMESLFGYERDLVIGRKFTEFDFFTPDLLQETIKNFEEVIAGRSFPGLVEFEAIHKSGRKIFFEANAGVIREEGRIKGLLITLRDITERKHTERELIEYQNKLRSLSDELLLTEEEERRRIATDLHDRIGQALAIAKIKLGELRQSISSSVMGEELDAVRKLIEQTILDTRSLTFELSPPVLYEFGFEAAIEWLVEQIHERYGVRIEFQDDGQEKPVAESVRVLLFRSARELLINTVKHAEARTARVWISRSGDTIEFRLEDDGVGFDPSQINSSIRGTGGFGLFSIRDRLSHIGGDLRIESRRKEGTRVVMTAPVQQCRDELEAGSS